MDSIISVLEDFEKIIYKILLWFILIPKTILKIIIDPDWVTGYVHTELNQTEETRFDDYMSPILLFLIVILVPMVGISFIPNVGMNITTPSEGELTCSSTVPESGDITCLDLVDETGPWRFVRIGVESSFISNTSNVYHEFTWVVRSCDSATEPQNCTFWEGETQNEYRGTAQLTSATEPPAEDAFDKQRPEELLIVDNHTIKDAFYFWTDQPGIYRVEIFSRNFSDNDPEISIEAGDSVSGLNRTIYIFVSPQMNEQQNEVITDESGRAILADRVQVLYDSANIPPKQREDVESVVKSSRFIFLGLGLLLLPLLFSLATRTVKSSDISEILLKETFYIQCYYFVPVGLAFWALYYSLVFYTSDISPIIWLVEIAFLGLILFWFLATETKAVREGRNLKSNWAAFRVMAVYLAVLIIGLIFIALLLVDADMLRKAALWAYPIAGGLIILYQMITRRRKKPESQAKDDGPASNTTA
jgi:hypothetical protein